MVLGFPPSARRSTRGRRRYRRGLLIAAAAVAALAAVPALAVEHGRHHASAEPPAIKAGFLVKFTPFAAWPEKAFESATSPFRLCLGGADPFGDLLDHIAEGQRVGDHPLQVTRLATVGRTDDCHMLFLSASRTQTPRQMLAAVAGRPVLTVADEALEAPGAMIQFVTVDGRLRFDIRADIAQAEGVALSSKLQSLSVSPRGAP